MAGEWHIKKGLVVDTLAGNNNEIVILDSTGKFISSSVDITTIASSGNLDSLRTELQNISAGLDNRIDVIESSYITKSEVQGISSYIQNEINNIPLSNYTLRTETSAVSGYLQDQINAIDPSDKTIIFGGNGISVVESPNDSFTVSVSGSYALISYVDSASANSYNQSISYTNTIVTGLSAQDIDYSPSNPLYFYNVQYPTNVKLGIDGAARNAYFARQTALSHSSTGIIQGGQLSVASPTTITISGGVGQIVDPSSLDSGNSVTSRIVIWMTQTVTVPTISSSDFSMVYMDLSGSPQFIPESPTPENFRNLIQLGKVIHRDGTVNFVSNIQPYPVDLYNQYADLASSIGSINIEGNIYEPGNPSSDLTLKKSSGSIYRLNSNTINTILNPHLSIQAESNPVSFFYVYRSATEGRVIYSTLQTLISPNSYDDGSGTLQSVSSNNWTIQRIYLFGQSGRTYIFYGQNTYLTKELALAGIRTEAFENPAENFYDASFRGWILVKEGISNFNNPLDYEIIHAGKFGDSQSGGNSIITTNRFSDSDFAIYYDSQPDKLLKFDLSTLDVAGEEITIAGNPGQSGDITLMFPETDGYIAITSNITDITNPIDIRLGNVESTYITKTETSDISGYLQNQINAIDPSDKTTILGGNGIQVIESPNDIFTVSVSGDYATVSQVSSISGNLQQQINNIPLSSYTLRTETSAVSGYLQNQINTIPLSAYTTRVETAAISGFLNNKFNSYTTRTETSAVSGYLQNQINSIDVRGGSGIQVVESPTNTFTVSVSGNYATVSQVSSLTGSLQQQINAIPLSSYTLRTETAAVSGFINNKFNLYTLRTESAAISAYLQNQLTSVSDAISAGLLEPTGFENRTDSVIGFDLGSLTFTISGGHNIYSRGSKIRKTGVQQKVITATSGSHYFYYNLSGILTYSTTLWDLLTTIPIAYVYLDATLSKYFLLEERHGTIMDAVTHNYLHFTRGSQYKSGLTIGSYNLNSDIPADNKYSISTGDFFDEDIINVVSGVVSGGPYTVLYRSGGSGDWTWSSTEAYPYFINAGNIRYNQYTGATWQLTDITTNNRWVNYYVLVTNSIGTGGVFIIPGQTIYTSLALAQSESLSSLSLGNFPFSETIALYRITHQYSLSFSATNGDARIVDVVNIKNQSVNITTSSTNTHNNLSGLQGGTAGEYFHLTSAQYADYIGSSTVATLSGSLDGRLDVIESATYVNKLNNLSGTLTLVQGSNIQITDNGSNQITISASISGGSTDHNTLANLQGGTLGEYYHLTQAQANDYIGRTEVSDISGYLQNQINGISPVDTTVVLGGNGIQVIESPNDTFIVSVSGDYATVSQVSSLTGSLQQQINAIPLSDYTLRTETAAVSAYLQYEIDNIQPGVGSTVLGGTGIQVVESPANTFTVSVSGNYIGSNGLTETYIPVVSGGKLSDSNIIQSTRKVGIGLIPSGSETLQISGALVAYAGTSGATRIEYSPTRNGINIGNNNTWNDVKDNLGGLLLGRNITITCAGSTTPDVFIGSTLNKTSTSYNILLVGNNVDLGANNATNAVILSNGGSFGSTTNSVIIGRPSDTATDCVIVGRATSAGIGGVALGKDASAGGSNSVVIGREATTNGFDTSVAIGYQATSTKSKQIILGKSTNHTEVYIPATTVSTNSTSGALVVAGGVAVGKRLYVNEIISATGNISTSGSLTTPIVDGKILVSDSIGRIVSSGASVPDIYRTEVSNISGYLQYEIDNIQPGGGSTVLGGNGIQVVESPANTFTVSVSGNYATTTQVSTISGQLQTKIFYNVKDFGAKGDNSSDDTTSIQNAINTAAVSGGVVFFPEGIYLISQPLTIYSYIEIMGVGAEASEIRTNVYGVGATWNGGGTQYMLDGGVGNDIHYLIIRDIGIRGAGIDATNSSGIRVDATNNALNNLYENIKLYQMAGDGYRISIPVSSCWKNCRTEDIGGNAWRVSTATGCSWLSCYANGAIYCGYLIQSSSYCSFQGCSADSCSYGYNFSASKAITLNGCGTEATTYRAAIMPDTPGIAYNISSCDGVGLYGCYSKEFIIQGVDSHNSKRFINVETSTSITLQNSKFWFTSVGPDYSGQLTNRNNLVSVNNSIQDETWVSNILPLRYVTDVETAEISGYLQFQIDNITGGNGTTINGLSGAVVLSAGPNIQLIQSGQTITISGGAGGSLSSVTDANIDSDADVLLVDTGVVFDGGGSTPISGSIGYNTISYNGTIMAYTMLANTSGASAEIEVWKVNDNIPTVANKISGTGNPILTNQQYVRNTDLSGWTNTTIVRNDVVGYYLKSASNCSNLRLTLKVKKT